MNHGLSGADFDAYEADLVEVKWRADPKTGGPLPLRIVMEIPHLASMYAFQRHVAGGMDAPLYVKLTAIQPPLSMLADPLTGELP